ncbi:hypothetical protein BU16DRAFT_554866 [Lophium mytilinum]|uniref:Uncharacterized protein n=1 Tax=Lophium mytilinum TaxID=390894 RepID=A0A6A6RGJ6_9PEZI|nr:hypothetical protein BU16DRAFT_554866 [Lophium mytilinum]
MSTSIKLRNLSLTFFGWPPDVRICPWDWQRPEGGHEPELRVYSAAIDSLFGLKKLTRLHVKVVLEDWLKERPDGINRVVAFVQLLRSRLLNNGDKLGFRKIFVSRPHYAKEVWALNPAGDYEPTTTMRRHSLRYITVTCDDDSKNRSHAEPPRTRYGKDRSAQLQICQQKRMQFALQPWMYTMWLRDEYVERDYTASDGGSQDSRILLEDWRRSNDIHPDWGDGSKEAHGYDLEGISHWLDNLVL